MKWPSLQRLLPRCNVASMVALQPQMFLARTPDQLEAQVGSAYDIIQRDLPVAYVDAMIQVCPQHHISWASPQLSHVWKER